MTLVTITQIVLKKFPFQSLIINHQKWLPVMLTLLRFPGRSTRGVQDDHKAVMADPPADGYALGAGSKSLVTGRKGFNPNFKNHAFDNLFAHVQQPVLLTKALSLTEAACISRLLGIHRARNFN